MLMMLIEMSALGYLGFIYDLEDGKGAKEPDIC